MDNTALEFAYSEIYLLEMELRKSPFQFDFDESGIYVFESRHAPGFEMEMGNWNFDKICLIQQGSGVLITADSEIPNIQSPLTAGDIIYLPAGNSHRFEDDTGNPMTLVMICFFPDTLRNLLSTQAALETYSDCFKAVIPFNLGLTHRRPAITALLQRMVFEQSTERSGYAAILWGYLVQLLVMLTRSKHEVNARAALPLSDQAFAQSLEFLDERFTDPLQINDLASMAGLSYRRYTTLFKQAKGETVNAYLTRLRIDYAKKRLGESGNVLVSALESGFGDLSHFYRVFKKETGLTPKQFIKTQS